MFVYVPKFVDYNCFLLQWKICFFSKEFQNKKINRYQFDRNVEILFSQYWFGISYSIAIDLLWQRKYGEICHRANIHKRFLLYNLRQEYWMKKSLFRFFFFHFFHTNHFKVSAPIEKPPENLWTNKCRILL